MHIYIYICIQNCSWVGTPNPRTRQPECRHVRFIATTPGSEEAKVGDKPPEAMETQVLARCKY